MQREADLVPKPKLGLSFPMNMKLNLPSQPTSAGDAPCPIDLVRAQLWCRKKIIFVFTDFLKKICLQALTLMGLISLGCFMLDVLKIDM